MLTKLGKQRPGMNYSWTTVALQAATEIPRHKDSHNERGTSNYVMELNTDSVEGLWVQDCGHERMVVGGDARDHQYESQDGQLHDGCLVKVRHRPAVFDPLVHHAFVNEGGLKWFFVCVHPSGSE